MNRKFLEELLNVIEDEAKKKEIVDTLMAKNGELIESHKTEVATLKNDLKVKDGVVNNLNEKIKELEEVDVEAIKQEQFNLGKAEGSKEVETFKKSIALDKALANSKAKDIKLLEKLLDSEKLTYEEKDGNYVVGGLDGNKKYVPYVVETSAGLNRNFLMFLCEGIGQKKTLVYRAQEVLTITVDLP